MSLILEEKSTLLPGVLGADASLLTDAQFNQISKLVLEKTGIVLREEKRSLVYGRLAKRLRILNLNNFGEYCRLLEGPEGKEELGPLINAITTNLTRFFREEHHFDHIKNVLIPEIVTRYQKNPLAENKRVRFWSAGCSSGEEPYSLAMTLADLFPPGFDIKILATDIDTNMIERAFKGVYSECKGISSLYLSRFCEKLPGGEISMGPEIRKMISFKPLNLLDPWPMKGPFDGIFCRNVVIYFDKNTQRSLFSRIAELMNPGTWLYIGHSESLFKVSDDFILKGRTIYQRGAYGH